MKALDLLKVTLVAFVAALLTNAAFFVHDVYAWERQERVMRQLRLGMTQSEASRLLEKNRVECQNGAADSNVCAFWNEWTQARVMIADGRVVSLSFHTSVRQSNVRRILRIPARNW